MLNNKTFLQKNFDLAIHESNYVALKRYEKVLEETFQLTHESELFLRTVSFLIKTQEFERIGRLCNWFIYFNENQFKSSIIYNGMVGAVLGAVEKHELIFIQTQLEFETSKSFFDAFYSLELKVILNNPNTSNFFFNMSLIYGCYPGMQVGSLRKAFSDFSGEINQNDVYKAFENIFIKYETPKLLLNEFDKITDKATIEVLLGLLRGKNLRQLNYTDLKLSKREVHLFVNYNNEPLGFGDNVFLRYLVYFKLLSVNEEKGKVVINFLNCSKLFKSKLHKFVGNITFWQQAIRLYLSFNEYEKSRLPIMAFVDFVEFKKFEENASYTLTGRTFDSIYNAINQWHAIGSYSMQQQMLGYKWEPLGLAEIDYTFKCEVYVFQELTDGKKLALESQKMNHCVFSYTSTCAKGFARIFSVKKKVNNKMNHWLTVKLNGLNIVQAVGVNNRKLSKVESGLLFYWAKENTLRMDYSEF